MASSGKLGSASAQRDDSLDSLLSDLGGKEGALLGRPKSMGDMKRTQPTPGKSTTVAGRVSRPPAPPMVTPYTAARTPAGPESTGMGTRNSAGPSATFSGLMQAATSAPSANQL